MGLSSVPKDHQNSQINITQITNLLPLFQFPDNI